MMESDLDLDLDCAHTNVEFTPYVCVEHNDMHDAWECQECGMEFVPAHEAEEWRDAAHDLREGMILLGREHARLKIASAVLAVFTFGLLVGRR